MHRCKKRGSPEAKNIKNLYLPYSGDLRDENAGREDYGGLVATILTKNGTLIAELIFKPLPHFYKQGDF